MREYAVGGRYPELIKNAEGAVFDITDAGANLILYFHKPTKEEIKNIKSGRITYWLSSINGVIWFFWKFGSLNAIETPYHKKLSVNLTELKEPNLDTGYAVNIILADPEFGEIKAMRYISLSEKVSRNFFSMYLDQPELTRGEIGERISECQRKYTTKQMINFATLSGRTRK